MNGVKHTIIGVAPPGFYGTFVGYFFQFWVPASMEALFSDGNYKLENRGARWIEGFAKLKPGVTIAQAQAEATAIAKRLEHDYPETNRARGVKLYPLWATPFNQAGNFLPTLRVSVVVAAFVLVIACANVGNLLLVRSFCPAPGDGRPPFGRGEIQPAAETASDRTIGAVIAGRCRRIPDRVLVPEPDRLTPAHCAGRTGEHAGRN